MGWTCVHGPVDRVPRSIGLFRGLKKCPPDTFLPCQGKAALFESYIWNAIPKNKTHPIGWVLFLVDDIGLEPMTFRTSKEAPSGTDAPEGAYTLNFRGQSVNRVDPIGTALS